MVQEPGGPAPPIFITENCQSFRGLRPMDPKNSTIYGYQRSLVRARHALGPLNIHDLPTPLHFVTWSQYRRRPYLPCVMWPINPGYCSERGYFVWCWLQSLPGWLCHWITFLLKLWIIETAWDYEIMFWPDLVVWIFGFMERWVPYLQTCLWGFNMGKFK